MGACYPKRQAQSNPKEAGAPDRPRNNQVSNSPQNSVVSNNGIKVAHREVDPTAHQGDPQPLDNQDRQESPGPLDALRSQRSLDIRELPAEPPRRQSAELEIPEELAEGEVIMIRRVQLQQPRQPTLPAGQFRPDLVLERPNRLVSLDRAPDSPRQHSDHLNFTQPKLQNYFRPSEPTQPSPYPIPDPHEPETDPDLLNHLPEQKERPAAQRPTPEIKDEVIAPWKVAGAELSEGEKHLSFADSINHRIKNHQYLGCEYLLKKNTGLTFEDVWRPGSLKISRDLQQAEREAEKNGKGKGLLDQLFGFGAGDKKAEDQEPIQARPDNNNQKPPVSVTLSVARDKLPEVMERFSRFRKELEKAADNCLAGLQVNPDGQLCELFVNDERVFTFSDPNHLLKPSTITEVAKKAKKK